MVKLQHSCITSPVFELVKVIELDLTFGDDFMPHRIEILRDTSNSNFFRCRIWEFENFNLIPTFPCDDNGKPLHISTDIVPVERSISYRIRNKLDYTGFEASSTEAALQLIIEDLKLFLAETTGEKPKQ
jgi:hypothetical protein